ncbi:hypothetical protein VKT23_020706 [Stygiomarasmius scandens]|uniref:Uncharacterized protein n=1 Tax=Marasmiellus scandens TaxID=2682957 RepID=A0ABR1IM88_9AGAR
MGRAHVNTQNVPPTAPALPQSQACTGLDLEPDSTLNPEYPPLLAPECNLASRHGWVIPWLILLINTPVSGWRRAGH